MNNFTLGQQVQYDYDKFRTRTGEVVEYDAATNRYRVFWHTEKHSQSPDYVSQPNKRTWVKADALRAAN